MKNINTDVLKGAALNWAVAKCRGLDLTATIPLYTSGWSLAGPIILEKKIVVVTPEFEYYATEYPFLAWMPGNITSCGGFYLSTAMRCYVKSELGDQVAVPISVKPIVFISGYYTDGDKFADYKCSLERECDSYDDGEDGDIFFYFDGMKDLKSYQSPEGNNDFVITSYFTPVNTNS